MWQVFSNTVANCNVWFGHDTDQTTCTHTFFGRKIEPNHTDLVCVIWLRCRPNCMYTCVGWLAIWPNHMDAVCCLVNMSTKLHEFRVAWPESCPNYMVNVSFGNGFDHTTCKRMFFGRMFDQPTCGTLRCGQYSTQTTRMDMASGMVMQCSKHYGFIHVCIIWVWFWRET